MVSFKYKLYDYSGEKLITSVDDIPNHMLESFTGIVLGQYTKSWYQNGSLSRKDGPARIWFKGNYEHFYQNGKHHRLDGPAIQSIDDHYFQWYIDGKRVTEEQHKLLHSIMKLKGLI